jgi:hypothetical protein
MASGATPTLNNYHSRTAQTECCSGKSTIGKRKQGIFLFDTGTAKPLASQEDDRPDLVTQATELNKLRTALHTSGTRIGRPRGSLYILSYLQYLPT